MIHNPSRLPIKKNQIKSVELMSDFHYSHSAVVFPLVYSSSEVSPVMNDHLCENVVLFLVSASRRGSPEHSIKWTLVASSKFKQKSVHFLVTFGDLSARYHILILEMETLECPLLRHGEREDREVGNWKIASVAKQSNLSNLC